MIEVKITPQRATTGTMETVLHFVCGALAGEDFKFTVIQVNDTTLHVQATDDKGEEVF
jgi:hypothetical protein